MVAASSYTSVTIAVRGKSLGKHSRGTAAKLQKSDTAVAQDQLRKNIHAVLGTFKRGICSAGFQTNIAAETDVAGGA